MFDEPGNLVNNGEIGFVLFFFATEDTEKHRRVNWVRFDFLCSCTPVFLLFNVRFTLYAGFLPAPMEHIYEHNTNKSRGNSKF
jgi:hypothetical protein